MSSSDPVTLARDTTTTAGTLRGAAVLAVLCVLASVSVAIDGFRWGLGNNALQAPILQRAVDPTLFPGDPFIATLDKYTSAVWWLLAQVGHALEIREWEPIIFALHLVSRVLFLGGLHALIGVYVRDRRVLLACVAVLALGASLRGPSVVGVHGLMGRVPDHTALATAVGLFAIAAALRARHVVAAVFAALAFDINAFVGVWLVPVVVVTLYATRSELRGAGRAWFTAAASYGMLTAPVAAWVFSAVAAPSAATAPPLDYRAFLYEYFPKHFFIDSAARDDLQLLATIVLVGVVGVLTLGPAVRGLRACYAAWIGMFLLGAAAPYLTSSPSVLNLHLLRMDGFLMILAAVVAATVAAVLIDARQAAPGSLAVAVGTLSGLATGFWWLTLAGVGAAAAILPDRSRPVRWLAFAALGASAVSVLLLSDHVSGNRGMTIVSALALVGTFLVTGAPAAAAFALAAVCSRTQQPKAVAVSLVALAVSVVPLSDASRRRGLAYVLLLAAGLLGVMRASMLEHRLMIGFVIVALAAELLVRRVDLARLGALRIGRFGYAGLVGLVALGALAELRRPGPRDPLEAQIGSWRELQEWAKSNTRIDDVFAVPDWPDGFGVWSERSIWVNWKHGAAVMWDPAYHPVYQERRRLQKETADPLAFAQATGVCFAVANIHAPRETFPRFDVLAAGLPVTFRNDRFAVVDLCPARSGGASRKPVAASRPAAGGPNDT